MKKIYSFVLLAATLLLSTNLWAEGNVAKVGESEYATFDAALQNWTDGTTLTILQNCEYTATAAFEVKQNTTLDLNGQTLIWKTSAQQGLSAGEGINLTIQDNSSANKGTFAFESTYAGTNAAAIYAAAKTTPSKLTIKNINITANFCADGTKYIGNSVVYTEKSSAVNVDIEHTNFTITGLIQSAVILENVAGIDAANDKLADISITYQKTDKKGYALSAFKINRPCTL